MNIKKTTETYWYLLYTKPRAENKVALELELKGYTVYLPLQRILRVWSDRKKWIQEHLFKSYLFIQTELEKNFFDILNTHGVVKFVNFEKTPARVNEQELDLVKRILGEVDINFTSIELGSLELGAEVEIVAGPLIGHKGKLTNIQGSSKVVLELSSIQQVLVVTLPSEYVRAVNG